MTPTASAFDLPDRLAAKSDPHLIGRDEAQFSAIRASLSAQVDELSGRISVLRRAPGRHGQQALDRDFEIHRLTARLRTLRRFGLDLCLGRMVGADDPEPVYVGRLGLADGAGGRLLVDWRSPAAEPFFAATHANPMGLASRRRYRWTRGRITDYWDEVFTTDGLVGHAALDDQSAFIASLGASRSPRMRDVLATIAADQDAIIRARSRGALVVDGGPGTGKTVVALHRAAYLLYCDPQLGPRRGGVLIVGPHQPYLDYVADVLPSLGEEGVALATLRDLVPEGATAGDEADPEVAALKAAAGLVAAIEPAVALYEEPPNKPTVIATHEMDLWLTPTDWAAALLAGAGVAHNEARDEIWDELLGILVESHSGTDSDDAEVTPEQLRRTLEGNQDLHEAFNSVWPLLDPADIVADLWSVPAYLRMCAPWLTGAQVRKLQRPVPEAWTVSDLPLLDAARARLGDPGAARRRGRARAEQAARRELMDRVVADLIESDDSEMLVMGMLGGDDLRGVLVDDPAATPTATPDRLAGPFAHIVVDEAQELTDAQWQMLLARCPSRSFTIVGDRAQARHGFTESWPQRLARIGLDQVAIATLQLNYRTPAEVMSQAEPVIRAAIPDANVPTSVRATGVPVARATAAELAGIIDDWLAGHPEGIAAVIAAPTAPHPFQPTPDQAARVRVLAPELVKGLEFDLVVLIDPQGWGTDLPGTAVQDPGIPVPGGPGAGVQGAVDRYVAMTRTTQLLVIVDPGPR